MLVCTSKREKERQRDGGKKKYGNTVSVAAFRDDDRTECRYSSVNDRCSMQNATKMQSAERCIFLVIAVIMKIDEIDCMSNTGYSMLVFVLLVLLHSYEHKNACQVPRMKLSRNNKKESREREKENECESERRRERGGLIKVAHRTV